MDKTTRIENTSNKPRDSGSTEPKLLSPTATNMKTQDRSLNTIAVRLFTFLNSLNTIAVSLFTLLKNVFFMLLILSIIFIFIKIPAQQGTVILPFEISNDDNLSSIAIGDQLTAELMWIQQIHNIKNEKLIQKIGDDYAISQISTEQSLGKREMVVPKTDILEFSLSDIGTINMGSTSLDPGKLIIAFKNICPWSKPVTIIRGSLQRYGSTIVLVALLDGDNFQSWTVRQYIDNNNEEQLHEMIRNMAFRIVHDLPQSNVSAKTWEGLKYHTEALDAYHQYEMSGNMKISRPIRQLFTKCDKLGKRI